MAENLLPRSTQHFWRVPFWFYDQHLGVFTELKQSASLRQGWSDPQCPIHGLWRHSYSLTMIFYCNITDLWQCTAFFWGRRVTVRKATTVQRKASLGNGRDPLFGTRAWNIIVMREYFPSETGALPGMMLRVHMFHRGSGLSKAMVLCFQCQEWHHQFLEADWANKCYDFTARQSSSV